MARTAVRRRLTWQVATIEEVRDETATARTIRLGAPDWTGHRAGQHLDVRLTAEDGYRAERSYSIASVPGEPLEITVQRLDHGEVSGYLAGELRAGDEIEVRGPIGGYFVWDAADAASPLLLAAGGSGIVPFRSILGARARSGPAAPARLLYSARSIDDVIYRTELDHGQSGLTVTYALTRRRPPGWTGHVGRVDAALLGQVAWPAGEEPLAFVCGPTSFVEAIAAGLTGLGYRPDRVKTERYGGPGEG
jgi:ferredoxin-NADP reductase